MRLRGFWIPIALATLCFGALPWGNAAAQESPPGSSSASPKQLEAPLESHPGFFNFDGLDLFEREDLEIHISVKGPLLQLVANASSEPDLANILKRLRGVEVRVYTLPEKRRAQVRKVLDQIAGQLQKQGWKQAITVQVQRDHGYAFLHYGSGEVPIGLAAMYITDENQAVFVNIVGSLDTATIGRLARRFDLDLLAISEQPEPEPTID